MACRAEFARFPASVIIVLAINGNYVVFETTTRRGRGDPRVATILQYLTTSGAISPFPSRDSVAREAHEARAIRGGSDHLRRLIRDIRARRGTSQIYPRYLQPRILRTEEDDDDDDDFDQCRATR